MSQELGLRAALWVVSRLAPAGQREAVVGDLLEEYALRASDSSSSARRWCLRQIFASAPPLLWVRLRRAAWIATLGVALLAYSAVGVVEFIVNRAIPGSAAADTAYTVLDLIIPFPTVVLIAYVAARFRRRAPIVLGAIMLLMVTIMTLTSPERTPAWYRIAYFFAGPIAVFIGGALRSGQQRSKPQV